MTSEKNALVFPLFEAPRSALLAAGRSALLPALFLLATGLVSLGVGVYAEHPTARWAYVIAGVLQGLLGGVSLLLRALTVRPSFRLVLKEQQVSLETTEGKALLRCERSALVLEPMATQHQDSNVHPSVAITFPKAERFVLSTDDTVASWKFPCEIGPSPDFFLEKSAWILLAEEVQRAPKAEPVVLAKVLPFRRR